MPHRRTAVPPDLLDFWMWCHMSLYSRTHGYGFLHHCQIIEEPPRSCSGRDEDSPGCGAYIAHPSVLHRIRRCLVPFGPLQLYQHRRAVISPSGPWAGYMLQAQEYRFSRHWHCSIADSLYFNSTVTVLSQYCHSTVYSTVYSTVSFFATHSHDQEKFVSFRAYLSPSECARSRFACKK